MTVGEMIAIIAGIVIPMLAGFFYLGSLLGKMRGEMVTRKDLNGKLQNHQDRCPAYREVSSITRPLA